MLTDDVSKISFAKCPSQYYKQPVVSTLSTLSENAIIFV